MPLAPPVQRPLLVVANQYSDHPGIGIALPPRNHCKDDERPQRSSRHIEETSLRFNSSELPLLSESHNLSPRVEDKHLLHLQNAMQNHDSSSERDSGTGDSRKSRDNLDEVEDHPGGGLVLECDTRAFRARHGGGESTISLTEFEKTSRTILADIDINSDDDEDGGCGEAILSASNSFAASAASDRSIANSEDVGEASLIAKDCVPKELPQKGINDHDITSAGGFRTFRPKNRSLSRDFLNEQPQRTCLGVNGRWRNMGGSSQKRASAVELNGENYLRIERGCEADVSFSAVNPSEYRGGSKKETEVSKYHEKLLEHSLKSTDYSLKESQIVRNGRTPSSYVNSLPRSKRKRSEKSRVKSPTSSNLTSLTKNEHYSDVAQKADELFA